ncbi:MAG: polysaccharide deacetylase family protein [Gudongella sp.]|nr:polysaccharide deacetylase family protein [Gudongella sp.]
MQSKFINLLIALLLIVVVFMLLYPEIKKQRSINRHYVNADDLVDLKDTIENNNLLIIAMDNKIIDYKKNESSFIQSGLIKDISRRKLENKTEIIETNINDINSKIAYLTFDDGPSEKSTPIILETLNHYGIKATFFVVGNMAEKYPEMLKRVYESENAIGNHSYSHIYKKIYSSQTSFFDDINKTDVIFKKILGDNFSTDLLRFPGGTHAKYKKPFLVKAKELGYQVFDWNTVNGDGEGNNLTDEYLFDRFLNTYKSRDEVIILMHDTDLKVGTTRVLPNIIEHLINEGYIFKTLEEYNYNEEA